MSASQPIGDTAVPPPQPTANSRSGWASPLPIFVSVFPFITFILGWSLTLWQTRISEADTKEAQWRSALESIRFDEDDLIRSAYLMESFDRPYHSKARDLEVVMMDRTAETSTFDLIAQDMIGDTNPKDNVELDQLFDIDDTLSNHLLSLYNYAMRNYPATKHADFKKFLTDPTPYLRNDPRSLNLTFVYMWELDTFSASLRNEWEVLKKANRDELLSTPRTRRMLLLNYSIPDTPPITPQFQTIYTCPVYPTAGKGGVKYECKLEQPANNADSSQPPLY